MKASTKAVCVIAYTQFISDARVYKISQSLRQAGLSVDVITPREDRPGAAKEVNGVRLLYTPIRHYRGKSSLAYLFSYVTFLLFCTVLLTKKLVQRRYGLVYVNNMPDFLVFAAIPNKLLGVKVILDIHDPMPETYSAKFDADRHPVLYFLIKLQSRWSAAFADRIITVSEPVKQDILASSGIAEDKITVITNFADGETFRFLGEYSIEEPIKLIYYGTISARFGLEDILRRMADAKHKDRILFKIIGTGDGASSIKRAIRTYKLENIVDFENKKYPVGSLPDILKDYRLGIVSYRPSRATDYMLPVKMLEMAAAGIPVIALANKAIRFYFQDALYFQFDPTMPKSLTNLLDELIEHPELIRDKHDALLAARERYLWRNEAGKLNRLVLELLGEKRS